MLKVNSQIGRGYKRIVDAVIESIVKCVENDLPDWQSDAVRRLLTQNELTDEDELEILSMVKSLYGLNNGDQLLVSPKPLKSSDILGTKYKSMKLTMKAMSDLRNVNAIPDGSGLKFAHKGLSVMYGENRAGKSGYVRVMKRACKARDPKEKV
ncbi:hypothetical protein [Tepidibacillus decaturensis]|uniref:Uncharacterized protein n=1 Tax=Tepidibacillus decaturensis TaxID=1413211 RepID=A0A135L6C3_9BACI|nr:hypothetical protein [Tepidibacillus decaturensis]KXG44574.1 hypothetical protein U473_11510 [Tepidibacillus decaturensis]